MIEYCFGWNNLMGDHDSVVFVEGHGSETSAYTPLSCSMPTNKLFEERKVKSFSYK